MKKYIFLFLGIISVFSLISYVTKEEKNIDNTFSNTGFEIVNTTKDSVLMNLTINKPADSTWVQNVDGIFGINSSQLRGTVWVQPNDTLTYNPTLSFSGNVSFGTPPQNCPTDQFVNGINLFVSLNDISVEKYYNKYKCAFNVNTHKELIDSIKIIEEGILKNVDIKHKIPQYKVYEQVRNGNIKIFSDNIEKINNNLFMLKISGIWETETHYGITYKFSKIGHP